MSPVAARAAFEFSFLHYIIALSKHTRAVARAIFLYNCYARVLTHPQTEQRVAGAALFAKSG